MNNDQMVDDTPAQAQYQSSFRRRPIVVRDPKTGETRLVGNRGRSTVVAPAAARYRGGFDDFERRRDDQGFDDEGRAPIMKIVSGYRGRQIVVRDPSRRPGSSSQPPLGVRGGVKKAPYYDRRPAKNSPYSEEYDVEQRDRGQYFDDEEERENLYTNERNTDFDRDVDVDHRMTSDFDSRYDKQYYRNERDVQEEDDLTGKVVYVDNLSNDVTTRGLADLFGMVGQVKELRLLYDRQGNPSGSADIVFQRREDAEEAIRSLHNVPLNNRPMRLSMGNTL